MEAITVASAWRQIRLQPMIRTEYGHGFTTTVTPILSVIAKSKTAPKFASAVSKSFSTRDTCITCSSSSLPCQYWIWQPIKKFVTRDRCSHPKTIAARNFAVHDTRKRFSRFETTTIMSSGYLNEELRQMEFDNYLSSDKIILQIYNSWIREQDLST